LFSPKFQILYKILSITTFDLTVLSITIKHFDTQNDLKLRVEVLYADLYIGRHFKNTFITVIYILAKLAAVAACACFYAGCRLSSKLF
jgi:hypothetical protein